MTNREAVNAVRVGAVLRALRTRAGMTQLDVSKATGIGRAIVARLEAGRHLQTLDSIERYCTAVGASVREVFCID